MRRQGSESMLSRQRSPVFSKNEVKTLVNLVDKYKTILLNKSTNNAACRAKDLTWAKITKIFNSKGFEHKRKIDCLRMKWDNLKREARKANKNLLEVRDSDFDDSISQIVTMINEGEHNTSEVFVPKELEDDEVSNLQLEVPKDDSTKYLDNDEDKDICPEMFSGGENLFRKKRRRFVSRSMNFTPQECSLLLKCVRAEKKYVFGKINSNATLMLKNRAWARITNSFNRQSPNKRSLNVLRTKFDNMKRLGRKMGYTRKQDSKNHTIPSYTKLADDDMDILGKMKSEPVFEADDDSEQEDDVSSNCGQNDDNFDALHTNNINDNNVSPDPLSVIISSDSGIGLMNTELSSNSDKSEISKLKLELLKYQLENAKLDKKRIEDAMRAEASANESRATEMALRLRAARLEAAAAAARLPRAHPALRYAPDEQRALDYINTCQQN